MRYFKVGTKEQHQEMGHNNTRIKLLKHIKPFLQRTMELLQGWQIYGTLAISCTL